MSVTENLILPPNVIGKTRQILDFTIRNIQWKTSKAYTDIKVKVLWWGETEGVLCKGIKIDVNNKKIPEEPLKSLRYQIKTNSRLLFSYLKNAEPVKIEIYSTKTEDFIGSSKLEIPLKFEEEILTIKSQLVLPILSSRQFNLGDLTLQVELHPEVSMTQKLLIKDCSMDYNKKTKDFDANALKERSENKENIQVVGQKKKISFREPKPQKPSTLMRRDVEPVKLPSKKKSSIDETTSSTKSSSSIITNNAPIKDDQKSFFINYLSGAPMSRADEHKILQNLVTISPSGSVIESLNTIGLTTTHQQPTSQFSDKFDSIRIKVFQVELSSAGQREIQSFVSKNNQKCIVKCAVTSKAFLPSNDGIVSPAFENVPQRIPFEKEITKRITTPWNRSATFVNFGFCLKSLDQQTNPFYLGFARVDLAEVMSGKGDFHKKCPIVNECGIKVGCLVVKIELGINELHFGKELIESLYNRYENVSMCSNESITQPSKLIHVSDQKFYAKSHPSHSNQCDSDRNFENKTVQTQQSQLSQKSSSSTGNGIEDRDTEMMTVEKESPVIKPKVVYCGLLFIEGLRNVKERSPAEYFITYEGFWNQCQESTETSVEHNLNYLKQFPVICDDDFLKRVQNNHLELKLWERTENSEKWIGSTKLPLHQFYIAFRDTEMIAHLSLNQLPIISIDTWTNFTSPLSNELFSQGKVLLAIGRENQIDYLKLLRNLHNLRLPVPKKASLPDPNAQMKNKLAAFIDSLSQNRPEPSLSNIFKKPASVASSSQQHLKSTSDLLESLQSVSSSSSTQSTQPQLRKTSDLLDSLQKALTQPPVQPLPSNQSSNNSSSSEAPILNESIDHADKIRIRVSIEHATHLPKVIKKKANRRKNKNSTTPQKTESEPICYVTFESCLGHVNESSRPEHVVKSHEGFVHCTKLVKSCDPQWDQHFDIKLPVDVLTNQQKRFVVKVWRKASETCEMKAAPFEDVVIGFSAIDLSVLLTGLPVLSGYYNIIDFSSHCHGQIKLSLRPLEDVQQYQDSSTSLTDTSSLLNPLSIDVDDNGPNLLSRTLKRKFTELDEITQRLKARLFDVTSDENFDPDDEFERDLNTVVDDMEESSHNDQIDFSWLKNDDDNGQKSQNDFQAQLDTILGPQPSTSKASSSIAPRQVSGCSNPEPMAIDQLLKKYDLDTLINPSIFKNIYDPTLANSDSTPTLNPQPVNTDELANVSGDSGDTTVSSILSVDQIQTIQTAFQKTSLNDGSEQSSSRKDPEGENDISE